MYKRILERMLCILFGVCLWISCNPKTVDNTSKVDQFGCNEPPPDVFTSVGIDADFAQSKFGKIVTGDINLRTNPEVISLAIATP